MAEDAPVTVDHEVVARPSYGRAEVSPGIVHLGFGSFHRAHQAMYIDRLMNTELALDWGIIGVNVLDRDAPMHAAMLAQDCRYTLVEKHPDGHLDARVIGSVIEHLHAPDQPEVVLDRLADPRIRIVSLTITESGYEQDPGSGEFAPRSTEVLGDLAGAHPLRSAFGLLVEGLRRRWAAGIPPFTVLSCDNIQGNGDIARRSIVSFARRIDSELGDRIDADVRFPNTMVDRITPITTDDDRALVRSRYGIDDAWPVVCEPFAQWVVEDDFASGRPPLELVGVQVVSDVAPYETMKLRLLNASHQALAHSGSLLRHELVHEAVVDPDIRTLLLGMMAEARATLAPLPNVDYETYCESLLERYANPGVRDTIARLAMDSDSRLATFLAPTVRELLADEIPMPFSILVFACHLERSNPGTTAHDERRNIASQSDALSDLAISADVIDWITTAWTSICESGIRATIEKVRATAESSRLVDRPE